MAARALFIFFMYSRVVYQLKQHDGFALPVYPEDEILSDGFELKLARWLCHVDTQVCRARLAALDIVMFGQPSDKGKGTHDSDYVRAADRFGVSVNSIHVAVESMPHIPAIHVGWKAGYNSGRVAGLRARGLVRSDPRRGVKAMFRARGVSVPA